MGHFLLKCENPHIFGPVKAIVDTGSPTTLIGPLDLARMRISKVQLNRLNGRKDPLNYGGGEAKGKILEDAELIFGEHLKVKMPVKVIVESENETSQPSLIGVDFMLKHNCKLHFNPAKKEAYFEVED